MDQPCVQPEGDSCLRHTEQSNNASVVQLFKFKDAEVRLVLIEGNPWFVGKEVSTLLGFDPEEVSKRNKRWFSEGEYPVVSRSSLRNVEATLFGQYGSRLALITESGLYKLVMRSDKPEAKSFQDWVTFSIASRYPLHSIVKILKSQ